MNPKGDRPGAPFDSDAAALLMDMLNDNVDASDPHDSVNYTVFHTLMELAKNLNERVKSLESERVKGDF